MARIRRCSVCDEWMSYDGEYWYCECGHEELETLKMRGEWDE